MFMVPKRQKGANYTRSEIHLLLDKIKPYIHVIENKKTDTATVSLKYRVWSAVTQNYNEANPIAVRKGSQLKTLYENIKKRTKKEIHARQVYMDKCAAGETNNPEPKKIIDVGRRLIRMVPTLRDLWKNVVLAEERAHQKKINNPLTVNTADKSSTSQNQLPITESCDNPVTVKHEIIHNQDDFTETVGEISHEQNEVRALPNFHGYAIITNDNMEEVPSAMDTNLINDNSRDLTLCAVEREIKKRELEKLDLDIQMKKLELQFLKGRLKEQEINLKFKELEYEIKRSEFEKRLNEGIVVINQFEQPACN
ncbi:hypothetical protein Trydic_g22923 [Trypoxylus dichotomus]